MGKKYLKLLKLKLSAGLASVSAGWHHKRFKFIGVLLILFVLILVAGFYFFDSEPQDLIIEELAEPEKDQNVIQTGDPVITYGDREDDTEDISDDDGVLLEEARTIYVPEDYTTIQEAIDHAQNGDTIIVSPGLYRESILIEGKSIIVKSENPENPDLVAATILDADGDAPVVSFSNLLYGDAALKGLTITGGFNEENGGGIIIKDASPTIALNQIKDNQTMGYGGGIYIYGWSMPNIWGNQILNNSSELGGGGIALLDCLPVTINNNHFEGNRASFGGAINLGENCSVDLGDPDLNSYINNGSRDIFTRTALFSTSGIEVKNLYNYEQIIRILGEPQEKKNYVEGRINYDVELYYEDFQFLSSSVGITKKVFSDRFIGPHGLSVGDSAAKVINRYYYDEVEFYCESGVLVLFDDQDINYELDSVTINRGFLYFENGEPHRITYTNITGPAAGGCGVGYTHDYWIEDGAIVSMEITRS